MTQTPTTRQTPTDAWRFAGLTVLAELLLAFPHIYLSYNLTKTSAIYSKHGLAENQRSARKPKASVSVANSLRLSEANILRLKITLL